MPTGRYTVGVVGCGGMGASHAGNYAADDRAELVAFADPNADARESLAAEHDVSTSATHEDHADLLAAEDVDIVSVCTWPSTHARIVVDAAEAGVEGIYCEKPMSTSLGEAEAMIAAAERNDASLVIGTQRRFHPVHERARELLADGAVGDPTAIVAAKGDGLLNWGTHVVDLSRYLLDDPGLEWVAGQVQRDTDRYERRQPIEDRCVGHVCFDDGTRLTYESDLSGPELGDATIHVQGTEGVLAVDLDSSVRVVNTDGERTEAPAPDHSLKRTFLETFLDWLDGAQDDHRCDARHGRDVTEVLMALYESARTDAVVEAPLQTRANPLQVMIEDGDLPVRNPGSYDIRLPYDLDGE